MTRACACARRWRRRARCRSSYLTIWVSATNGCTRYPHELSGGELQRFCIARALATRPRYLICDEVSTMLDAVTQAHIWHVLLDYAARENAGMLLVSHTPALTARIATREVALA